jgi:hypothetical protein
MSAQDYTPPPRFRSREPFSLTPAGRIAEASYRSQIVTSRARAGRASYDAARSAWATSLALEPDDGAYLGELRRGAKKLVWITEALAVCGKKRVDAISALERLLDAGLVMQAETD